MRILYVVDYYQPQFGYSEYYIPKILSQMGHQVSILTSNYYYPFPNYKNTSGKLLGEREQTPGFFRQDKILVIKEKLITEIFTRAIIGNHEIYARILKPQLVIVNKSSGYNLIRMAQLKNRYKYKLLSYDAHLPSGFYAVGNIFLKEIFYFIFRLFFSNMLNKRVDKFVAVQEGTIEIMEKYYGQKAPIHIPLGTDTKNFYFNAAERNKIRKSLSINPNDFVIVYSGKVIETKGVSILFAAFEILCEQHKDIHLLIIGDGTSKYTKSCFDLVNKKHHSKIHMVGFKNNNELYKYYSASELGVWPLEESTSMNDIAACGRPFIANDSVGVEVRFSNNNASKYKKGDSIDLARIIEDLYTHPKKLHKMGENGLDLIKKKLSWEVIVKEYLSYVT